MSFVFETTRDERLWLESHLRLWGRARTRKALGVDWAVTFERLLWSEPTKDERRRLNLPRPVLVRGGGAPRRRYTGPMWPGTTAEKDPTRPNFWRRVTLLEQFSRYFAEHPRARWVDPDWSGLVDERREPPRPSFLRQMLQGDPGPASAGAPCDP